MDPLTTAANYLAPHGESFWRWSANLEALEWSDGTAIAFYEEVQAIIQTLAAHELPPFQSIVIFLGACQYNWLDTSRFQLLIGYSNSLDQRSLGQRLPDDWKPLLLEYLDRIHRLVSERKSSIRKFKCSLAERLFESGGARIDPLGTNFVLQQLEMGIPALILSAKGDMESVAARTDDFIAAVRCLLGGDWPADVREVENRIETGLSRLPNAADLPDDPELPDVERLRRLLTHLTNSGDELSGIARVAQNLMAAVHLPRALAEPEQMPLGGFSDISNRGPLDRLLITELAHDDETLSMRVALNEALYLRRESPPKTPQRRRALLIDCGIRLWGLPRVFATAVGLALAATAEKFARVSAFRPDGDQLDPSDLLTREGLIAHLAALDPSPHPAGAAANFIDLMAAEPDDVDPVLITHEKVLADPEFRRQLRGHLTGEPLYIATVDDAGHYQLFAFSSAGEKRLQQASIDLEQLLNAPEDQKKSSSELLREDIDPDLPSIFSMRLFPLRISYQYDPRRSIYHPDVGVIGHSKDGRLLLWDRERIGARIVSSEIPKGNVVWHHIDSEQRIAHLLILRDGYTLFSTNIDSGASQTHRLEVDFSVVGNPNKRTYCRHNQSLFIVIHDVAQMFSLSNGQACGSIKLPHSLRTHSGRFFRFNGEWYAFSGDLVPLLEQIHTGNLIQVFESTEHPAPIGLTTNGSLILLDGGENSALAHFENFQYTKPISVSDDTRRIAVETGNQTTFYDLAGQKAQLFPRYSSQIPDVLLNPEKAAIARLRRSPHINFRATGCSARGRIFLVSAKGAIHRIEWDAPSLGIVLRHLPSAGGPGENLIRDFEEIPAPGTARFKLQRAEWPCGTCAYLDSRGFLHIDPNSDDCPEITFTLHAGLLSGWTSDGHFFGQDYYTAPKPISETAAVFKHLEKITARILAYADLR